MITFLPDKGDGLVRFTCPAGCGTKLKARLEDAGKAARCRKCGHRYDVPAPPQNSTAPAQVDAPARNVAITETTTEPPMLEFSEPILDALPADDPPLETAAISANSLDSLPPLNRTEDDADRDKAPQLVALTTAEVTAIVRRSAQRHRMTRLLDGLGKVSPKKLARAKKSYAAGMEADESALVLIDHSFLQNGSKGMLLTDRRLYSDMATEPIPLAKIRHVTVDVMAESARFQTSPLQVNGQPVCRRQFNASFWMDALSSLGRAARGQTRETPDRRDDDWDSDRMKRSSRRDDEWDDDRFERSSRRENGPVRREWVEMAAGAASAGQSVRQIEDELLDEGVPRRAAQELADEVHEIRYRPQPDKAWLHIGGGAMLALVGIVLTIGTCAAAGPDGTFLIAWGPVIWGGFYVVRGIYRVSANKWPMTRFDLVTQWKAQHPLLAARWDER